MAPASQWYRAARPHPRPTTTRLPTPTTGHASLPSTAAWTPPPSTTTRSQRRTRPPSPRSFPTWRTTPSAWRASLAAWRAPRPTLTLRPMWTMDCASLQSAAALTRLHSTTCQPRQWRTGRASPTNRGASSRRAPPTTIRLPRVMMEPASSRRMAAWTLLPPTTTRSPVLPRRTTRSTSPTRRATPSPARLWWWAACQASRSTTIPTPHRRMGSPASTASLAALLRAP